MYAFAKPADFEFPHEKMLLKVGRWDDIGSLEGQLVNSRPPEVYSDLFAHIFTRVFSSRWREQLAHAFHAGPL